MTNVVWDFLHLEESKMIYKYKCFKIEVLDLIEEDMYDKNYPQDLFVATIYYNGECHMQFFRILESQAMESAEYWVREHALAWLGFV